MARLDRELRLKSTLRAPDAGREYFDSLDVKKSPLAKALESQAPARRYIPRPVSDREGTDIFGVPSESPAQQALKPDTPTAHLRAQRRKQQEEYARQLAEASSRQPVGGLKRDILLPGDSSLENIGRRKPPSPYKPSSFDPDAQSAREQKRDAQRKYAEQIRQDSMAKPIDMGRRPLRGRGQLNESDPADPVPNPTEGRRQSQRTYRENLDHDIAQRKSLSGGEASIPGTGSILDRFSGGGVKSKRSQQMEYARQIEEARNAAPIRQEYVLPRNRTARDDVDDPKYTAFKRSEGVDTGRTFRARSPVNVQDGSQYSYINQQESYPRDYPAGSGAYDNSPLRRVTEPIVRGSQHYSGDSYGSYNQPYDYPDDRRGIQQIADERYESQFDHGAEREYNRFNAMGEETSIGGYSAPSRRVQEFKERQRAYADMKDDYARDDRNSAADLSLKYGQDRRTSQRDEELRRKRAAQEAYAQDIRVSAQSAPIYQPRVSMIRDEFGGNGLPGGYRARGSSTGGGVSNFRLG